MSKWIVQYDELHFDLQERTLTEEVAGTMTDLQDFVEVIKKRNAYNIIITEV